jgi:hypothetical protein
MAQYGPIRLNSVEKPLTKTSATPLAPLGATYEEMDASGNTGYAKAYKYVKNSSGAAFVVGDMTCYLRTSTDPGHTQVSKDKTHTHGVFPAGVAISTVPDGSYGWIQYKGANSAVRKTSTNATSTGTPFFVRQTTTSSEDGMVAVFVGTGAVNTSTAINGYLKLANKIVGWNYAASSGAGASSTVALILDIPEW